MRLNEREARFARVVPRGFAPFLANESRYLFDAKTLSSLVTLATGGIWATMNLLQQRNAGENETFLAFLVVANDGPIFEMKEDLRLIEELK